MDITDWKWRILSFIENHNHDLSPSKSRHFAAFRHISMDTKRRLLINDNAGVRVNNSIKSSIDEAGGYENVTYNQKDVRNFLDKERRLKCKEGDGQALHDYFVRMQDTDSFVWVFRQWLQSMCGIAPKAIITDQCQAMWRAIEIVFPETVHRWCIWHITMKLPMKLAGLEAYQDIKHYLLKAVHESMTVEEFEEKWNHTITSHHLEENECVSESMNAFFDGYLHSSTTLKVFVEQFENAIRNKVEKEILSDFECFKGKLECSSSSPMEKQFQEAYTHEIFKRVRIEFSGRQGCILKELVRGGDEVKYKIEDEACSGKLFEVRFSNSECLERVTVLPDRYEKLHRLAVGVLEIEAESVENFNVLEKLLIDLKDNFSRSCDKQPSSQRKNSVGAASDVVRTEVVRSPMVVKRKGRPRMKRLKSSMEEAVSKPKKKRNTAAARNLAQSTSTTRVGGSAYGDGFTSNMEYPMSMPHSNDGVIDLTNPMPSQSFVSESMSQSQAHGNEDQALNLT
uniref:MULE transposase domain-containing protein n=1 Tax=Fagus sylvatica TaxID=28930 RepID=A0A2N9GLQ3_FAGSY